LDALKLSLLLDPLDSAPVECDGMSSLVATLLSKEGVQYQGMSGSIQPTGQSGVIPHFWIEVDDLVIDYRARMWLGDHPEIPHGVFSKADHAQRYQGTPVQINPLPEFIFQMLKMPFPTHLFSNEKKGSEPEPF
jgi:hypothetical protein